MAAFAELALWPELVRAVDDLGWQLPTPVQAEAIPLILGGSDVCAAAETGSGKTAAFALPSLQLTHEALRGVAVTEQVVARKEEADSSDWISDFSDKDGNVIAELRAESGEVQLVCFDETRWRGFRATRGVLTSGTFMFELTVESGLCRVGFGAPSSARALGTDAFSFGFGGTGKKSWNKVFSDYGTPFGNGDTVGAVITRFEDSSQCAGVIRFFINGTSLGDAFKLSPDLRKVPLAPGVCGRAFKAAIRYANFRFPLSEASPFTDVPLVAATHDSSSKSSSPKRGPFCICLAPTRDLVFQTKDCFLKLGEISLHPLPISQRDAAHRVPNLEKRNSEQSKGCVGDSSGKHLSNPSISVEAAVGGQGGRSSGGEKVDADVVVGTTEKLLSLIRRGALRLENLQLLIIDEADEVVRDDGLKHVLDLREACRLKLGRSPQTLFFSATLRSPLALQAIAALAPNASWVDLRGKEALPETTKVCVLRIDPLQRLRGREKERGKQRATARSAPSAEVRCISLFEVRSAQGLKCKIPGSVPTSVETDQVHPESIIAITTKQPRFDEASIASLRLAPDARDELLSCRVKQLKMQAVICLADAFKMESCWIVCRTNLDCDILQRFLIQAGGGRKSTGPMETGKENPYSCVVVASQRSQQERTESLKAFKNGAVRFLICTDAAARGIDAPHVPYLIMMTLPEEVAKFFHRVGRVGRAKCLGLAICLVSTEKEKVWYHACGTRDNQCRDRRLCSEGGCTIWYDEVQLLRDIEESVGSELPCLDGCTFHCPGIADPLGVLKEAEAETRRRRGQAREPVLPVYGRTAEDACVSNKINSEEIAASVKRLQSIEVEMQRRFVALAAVGLS